MSTPETNQAPGLTDAECRDRLRLILEIVRKYQPPHNISKDDVLCEVIRLLGPQSGGVDVAVKPAANQDADDLDDMLVVRHLSPRAAGETLRQAVDRIINWEMMVNMDPVVCSAAQALVYKGRDEGLVSVIQHLNQNPYSLSKSECIHTVQGMRGVSRDPPLAQDQDRGLFDALSRDPNARQHVRDAAQAIEVEHNSIADLAERMQGLADTPTANCYAEVLRKTCGVIAMHLRRLVDTDRMAAAMAADRAYWRDEASIKDLRQAKWLDPQCADRGACQSLVFKATPPSTWCCTARRAGCSTSTHRAERSVAASSVLTGPTRPTDRTCAAIRTVSTSGAPLTWQPMAWWR